MAGYADLPVWEQVPAYHMDSVQSRSILETTTGFSLAARAAILDVVDQLWVGSATWGLTLWEELLGIQTDETRSDGDRRAAILAKMLGAGTCNADMVSAIAKAITGYDSVVTEHFGDYTFSIRFCGESPGFARIDRAALETAVGEVKPAHLKFIIENIRWQDLKTLGYTWGRLKDEGTTWNDLAVKVMIHQKE